MTDIKGTLQLYGFNNLTKNLSLSLYFIHHVPPSKTQAYNHFINQHYHADKLIPCLETTCQHIGANVLNIAKQNYQPHGASVTILAEELANTDASPDEINKEILTSAFVAHLDKSHLCIHTYPESNAHNNLHTFRLDIEVATCGVISPLKALNYLLQYFTPDLASIDYRVRGFTRDIKGKKHFLDHNITQISDYLSPAHQTTYRCHNMNLLQQNLFYCQLKKQHMNLQAHLFEQEIISLNAHERTAIEQLIHQETNEIFPD